MKNVLVISTSLRTNSNSEALADAYLRGAADAGHHTEKVTLRGKEIQFCRGCLACQQLGRCVIQDDAAEISRKMHDADVIAFATPIYYYEMSGQMKTLLDRAFTDIYLMTAAAEDDDFVPDRAESGLTGWIDCFARARLAGSAFAGGINGPGETAGHKALAQAYEMGKTV